MGGGGGTNGRLSWLASWLLGRALQRRTSLPRPLPLEGDPGQTNVAVENNVIHAGGTVDDAISLNNALVVNHANITLKNNKIYPV